MKQRFFLSTHSNLVAVCSFPGRQYLFTNKWWPTSFNGFGNVWSNKHTHTHIYQCINIQTRKVLHMCLCLQLLLLALFTVKQIFWVLFIYFNVVQLLFLYICCCCCCLFLRRKENQQTDIAYPFNELKHWK